MKLKTNLLTISLMFIVFLNACHVAPRNSEKETVCQNPLQGVWRVVEQRDVTAGTTAMSRPSYQIFTDKYQMVLSGAKDRPKIKKSFKDMTAAEIQSQLPVGAGFLSYRIEGNRIIRKTLIALSAYYEGQEYETEFKLDGDRLVLRDNHLADGHIHEWILERVE